jgi:membrane protease YdiL (CAAX protease family)
MGWEIGKVAPVAALIRSYPLVAYSVLAFAFSIALTLLLNVSLVFGLLALFGPAAAALIVSRVWQGRAGVTELWAVTKRWRVHPGWYAAAVALPVACFALGHVLFVAAGNPMLPVPGTIQPILFVLFVLVIGEEVGWRGFLLRHLLDHRSPLVAAILVGAVWGLWHTPLSFIPGMPSYGGPFLAFAAWAMSLSFLLTWLWIGTRSVLLASDAWFGQSRPIVRLPTRRRWRPVRLWGPGHVRRGRDRGGAHMASLGQRAECGVGIRGCFGRRLGRPLAVEDPRASRGRDGNLPTRRGVEET